MSGSVVIDTFVGLAFVFLTASLICTGVIEAWASRWNARGDYLLRGLREMLDLAPVVPGAGGTESDVSDIESKGLARQNHRQLRQQLQDLAEDGTTFSTRLQASGQLKDAAEQRVKLTAPLADLILAHPLVAALHRPTRPGKPAKNGTSGGIQLTSYLSARTFAAALIDLLVPDGAGNTTIDELTEQVSQLDEGVPGRAVLLAHLRDAGDSVESFRHKLEGWYDEQMGRVSGWYKRWAQHRLLVAGLLLAALLNVDSVQIAQDLYHDQPVREAVVAQAVSAQGCPTTAGDARQTCLDGQQKMLEDLPLPIGWHSRAVSARCHADPAQPCGWGHPLNSVAAVSHTAVAAGGTAAVLKLIGLLLTGLAVSLGAPFWFDSLGKLGSLRTAGRRPGETAPYTTTQSAPSG